MADRLEYRVVTSIPEDDEWAAQELVSTPCELELAQKGIEKGPSPRYPKGTTQYIETRTITEWKRL